MLRVSAFAKVNLWLHLIGRRPDGFHEIETLMLPIGLADEITIEKSTIPALTCSDPSLPIGEDNLVIRAVRILEKLTDRPLHVRISLHKNIPTGAGLAGGSSDAVAVLKAVNTLYSLALDEAQLIDAAAAIGSDTAFFVRDEPAICRGRGEIQESAGDLSPLKDKWLLLIKPPFGVSTPWAYSRWAKLMPAPGAIQSLHGLSLRNDLERPVFEKFVALETMKDWLLSQTNVQAALMSGSGSTVFAILDSESTARDLESRALAHFGPTFWTCVTSFRLL